MSPQSRRMRSSGCWIGLIAFLTVLTAHTGWTAGLPPDRYENDDAFRKARMILLGSASVQRHDFHDTGDEDWVRFRAFEGMSYEIQSANRGSRADTAIELYDSNGTTLIQEASWPDEYGIVRLDWTCDKSGAYFIRVRQNDPDIFGKGTHYKLGIHLPDLNGFGSMTGKVKDAKSGKPVPRFKLYANGRRSDVDTQDSGHYLWTDAAGEYKVTLTAVGYHTVRATVKLINSKTLLKNFALTPRSRSSNVTLSSDDSLDRQER